MTVSKPSISASEALPHRNADPIMRLFAHYFEPADLMLELFLKLDRKAGVGEGLSRPKIVERRCFLMSWLSGLYVVVEGIKSLPLDAALEKLPMDLPAIATQIPPLLDAFSEYEDSLRLLRNAQFHYQNTAGKHVQFFDDPVKLKWAEGIHHMIARIFSNYRIGTTVVYALSGRRDEIDIKNRLSLPYSTLQYMK